MMNIPGGLARQVLKLNAQSPQLLFGAGVLGMVGSTVLACQATLKLEKVLDEGASKLETARTLEHREYSEKDRSNDLRIIKIQTGTKIVKLYAPAVGLGIVSIAALTRSHNILTTRNAALMAAYGALEKGFDEYRRRVVEKYGEEEDRNFRYGVREVDVVDDKGKVNKVLRVGDGTPSVYARFFDPTSTSWNKNPDYNFVFLRSQQNWANDLLKIRGHVFLNEVYDMLGLERSKAGSVVGWILIGEYRDNYIDFGLFDGDDQAARDFVNGREGSVLLDFNVDGVIWDKLDHSKDERLSWQLSN
jgi:hypothetical protein